MYFENTIQIGCTLKTLKFLLLDKNLIRYFGKICCLPSAQIFLNIAEEIRENYNHEISLYICSKIFLY